MSRDWYGYVVGSSPWNKPLMGAENWLEKKGGFVVESLVYALLPPEGYLGPACTVRFNKFKRRNERHALSNPQIKSRRFEWCLWLAFDLRLDEACCLNLP